MRDLDDEDRAYITRRGRILVYRQCVSDWAHMAPDLPVTVTTDDQVGAVLAAADHLEWLATRLIADAGPEINLLDVYDIWHEARSSLYVPDHLRDLYGINGPWYNPIDPAQFFINS
jgi:hypothetical protein